MADDDEDDEDNGAICPPCLRSANVRIDEDEDDETALPSPYS